MNNIALPKKIDFIKTKNRNHGQVIIEPCYPGYGTTLGNSLRRVLLSSLPGAAPIGIKIKKVNHEFSTIPHLKEDMLEFILNLKKLKLKVFSDEVVKLELDIHGEKEIRAADIKKNSLVEIINPDLILGHVTDMSGSLEAEIFVSRGMGYVMIESRDKKEKEIGYIEMDSIFSPVLSVGVHVENVRVGKMTNWDKLVLDIGTDGTITPREAFQQAVEILIAQYRALAGKKPEDKEAAALEKTDKKNNNGKAEADEKAENEKIGEDKGKEDKIKKQEKEEEEKPKKKRGRPRKAK